MPGPRGRRADGLAGAAVTFDAVGLDYAGRGRLTSALDGLSFEIPRGTTAAFVGPSGCGKSTLLKLAAGLIPATRGRVRVDGAPVTGPQHGVGMAFQNPVLLPWRTVLDNVLLPFEILASRRGGAAPSHPIPTRPAQAARARELLATVGLRGAEDKHPRELSGGMRQRVSLCRALVHEPELLLLDEPFAALDAFTREEMWELHQALRGRRPVTAILVTHDLREAAFLADEIYVLGSAPGRIVYRHQVPLPFPRRLAECDGPEAAALVGRMRQEIRDVAR